jgi:histone H3/H4
MAQGQASKAVDVAEALMSDISYVTASKVKEMLKGMDCRTGSDALDGLNGFVHWLINEAVASTKANGRSTVRAHDFLASAPGSTDSLVTASKGMDLRTSADALDGLNAYVHHLVATAAARATANGRSTVRAHDFVARHG